MGLPTVRPDHPAAGPDPGDPDVPRGARRLRTSFPRSGCSSTTAPARRPPGPRRPGDPYPGFEQDFSSFPIPGTTAHTWYLGPDGTLADQPPTSEGVNWYTSNANALPLTDYGSNTGSGGLVGQRIAVAMELGAESAGHGRLLCFGAADDGHRRHRRPAPSTSGCARRPPMSTFRPRSARSVRTGTRRSSRTAGSGRASASCPPVPTTCSSAEHAARPDPQFQEGRCRAHAGRQVRRGRHPAVLRGARLPCGIAHSCDDLRAQRHATGLVVRPDGARWNGDRLDRLLHVHAVEPHSPGRSGRAGPDGSARVPEPPQRAVQAVPAEGESYGLPLSITTHHIVMAEQLLGRT